MSEFATGILVAVVSFLPVLTLVVTVHELGHFWAAKAFGVKIDRFSIGFGQSIWSRVDRSGVEWRLAWIPLGGYVKFAGDANAASVPDKNDLEALRDEIVAREGEGAVSRYFHFKPVWQRALIVAAGPFANFVLAVAIFAALFGVFGEVASTPRVERVLPGSAAERAGLLPGDLILAADGRAVAPQDLIRTIRLSSDTPLRLDVERGGERLQITAVPAREVVDDPVGGKARLGVLGAEISGAEARRVSYGPLEAVARGTRQVGEVIGTTVSYLGRIFTGRESGDQIGGPIGIAKASGALTSAAVEGAADAPLWLRVANVALSLIQFAALISVAIGFINLLPVPVLDGGHLLFYAYEAVAGQPLSERIQAAGYRIGLALLLGLMLFATWNDLKKLPLFEQIGGLLS